MNYVRTFLQQKLFMAWKNLAQIYQKFIENDTQMMLQKETYKKDNPNRP